MCQSFSREKCNPSQSCWFEAPEPCSAINSTRAWWAWTASAPAITDVHKKSQAITRGCKRIKRMNLFYGVFSFGLFPRQTQAMMDGNEHSREECSFSMLVDKFTAL